MVPEMAVRKLLHSLGFRYRLHAKDLPGKPDIVFRGQRKVVFVHGCYWHQHDDPDCKISHIPKSNQDYWLPKLQRNVDRDKAAIAALQGDGWKVLVIWECELKNMEKVSRKLITFLA